MFPHSARAAVDGTHNWLIWAERDAVGGEDGWPPHLQRFGGLIAGEG